MMAVNSFVKRFKNIHARYVQISSKKPYITAMITGGSILTLSDMTAQYLSSNFVKNYKYDFRRTVALGLFGTFYYGLVARKIYFVYELVLGPNKPMLKALIDCGLHSPFILLPCFYFMTGLIKGQSVNSITTQLSEEWWTSSTATFAYWLPMMWVNFKYCSPQTRIFFIATMSWAHKSALSWYSNRNRVKQRMQSLDFMEVAVQA